MSAFVGRADSPPPAGPEIIDIEDDRGPEASEALGVIRETFAPKDRQSLSHIAMEVTERRLGLTARDPYHILCILSESGRGMAAAAGVYLSGANAGLVGYLGVRPEYREHQLGRRIRRALVEKFREDARRQGHRDLAWVVGEVRVDNPWLLRLVRERAAIPFDFTYYHPGVAPGWSEDRWILYRQAMGDHRAELPASEVMRLVYEIWRRAYRARYPLEHEGFAAMVAELEQRTTIGAHPDVQ
jgi:GNAT superfamily N-acetyltransferase